jgi:hypothetical protein
MSPQFTLNKADLISIGKSVALAAAGAAVAYLLQVVIPNIHLGNQAWLIPVLTVALNAAQKWISGQPSAQPTV